MKVSVALIVFGYAAIKLGSGVADDSSKIAAGRPVLGFFAATASGAGFVAALWVYSDDDAMFLTGSRLGDDLAGFGALWLLSWIALTLLAFVPFALLFRIGRGQGVLTLPGSLVLGVATSASIYFIVLFLFLATVPPHSSSVGFLLEGNAFPKLLGIALAAGLIGGVTFWWVGYRGTHSNQ